MLTGTTISKSFGGQINDASLNNKSVWGLLELSQPCSSPPPQKNNQIIYILYKNSRSPASVAFNGTRTSTSTSASTSTTLEYGQFDFWTLEK